MFRTLGGLPGGLGKFLPCRIGANHCRLRSIGWERCGHGLTSRPLETSDAGFLDDLLSLFNYSVGSGQSLVDGSLRMRYCSSYFSHKKPTWGLPHSGGVAVLVDTASFRPTVVGLRGSGDILSIRTFGKIERKRIRLTKKTNVRKRFRVDVWEQPIPKRWKADVFRDVVSNAQSVVVVHSGVGSSHLVNPWELADIRLHSPTPPGCMFRALSEIHARVFWISECG